MKFNKPFFWHHGTFMQPEYLQYQDMYFQNYSARMSSFWAPYSWGFSHLDINEASLASGVFEIKQFEAIFRDHSWCGTQYNTLLLPRSFANDWRNREEPFNIYLGIKKLNPQEANVTVVETSKEVAYTDSRYVTVFDQITEAHDIYEGGGESQLETLSYVAKIFWESELEDKTHYSLLPVARLVERNTEVLLDSFFIPPCISLQPSHTLFKVTDFVIDDIAAKVTQLEQYKRESHIDRKHAETPLMLRYKSILQVLVRYLPMLKHYRSTTNVHPWELYGILRQLVGELSVYSTHMNALGARKNQAELPNYEHLSPGVAYSAAYTRLRQLLGDLTIDPGLVIDLEPGDHGIVQATIPDEFFAEGHEFYLMLFTQEPANQWLERFTRFAKVGPAHEVAQYVARALPGLDLQYMPTRPSGVRYQENAHYFSINHGHAIWQTIMQFKTIGMKWEDSPTDLHVSLVVAKH